MATQILGEFTYEKFLKACDADNVNETKLKEIARQISGKVFGTLQREIKKNGYHGRSTGKFMLEEWCELQDRENTDTNLVMSVERLQEILRSPDVGLSRLASDLVDHRDRMDREGELNAGYTNSTANSKTVLVENNQDELELKTSNTGNSYSVTTTSTNDVKKRPNTLKVDSWTMPYPTSKGLLSPDTPGPKDCLLQPQFPNLQPKVAKPEFISQESQTENAKLPSPIILHDTEEAKEHKYLTRNQTGVLLLLILSLFLAIFAFSMFILFHISSDWEYQNETEQNIINMSNVLSMSKQQIKMLEEKNRELAEQYLKLEKVYGEQQSNHSLEVEEFQKIRSALEVLEDRNCSHILIVLGGQNKQHKALANVETLSFPPDCQFSNIEIPDLPVAATNLVVVQNGSTIIACGGCQHPENCGSSIQQLQCFDLDLKNLDTGWNQIENLTEPRIYSSGFEYGGSIFITGGASSDESRRRETVDVLPGLNEPWQLGNILASPVTHHCIVKIHGRIFSTGGLGQEENVSQFDGLNWSKYGTFLGSRYDHGCTGLTMNGETLILVKGGRTTNEGCSFTEIFDVKTKKSHPQKDENCRESSTIHNINGRIFQVGGVYTSGKLPEQIDEIFVNNVHDVFSRPVNGFNLHMERSGHAALVIDIAHFM